jgi:iron complex transport system ATP-binding protein
MRIDAEEVTVRIGERAILDGVTVAAQPGEFLGLIGPNGAGKTTLLRLMAGLAQPAGGRITFDGRDANKVDRRALARSVAYLAQDGAVHWPLRVEALVALGRLPHRGAWGGFSADDEQAVERALQATRTSTLRHRTVGSLSGGERMRVLLARALATEAAMLLADEPVAALDPYHQLDAMALLRRLAREGMGVVAVLHDLTLAARFCDRLMLLSNGRVLADGAPDSVLSDENLRAAYGIAAHRGRIDGEVFVLPWSRAR